MKDLYKFNLHSMKMVRRIKNLLINICSHYDPNQLPRRYFIKTMRKISEMEKVILFL